MKKKEVKLLLEAIRKITLVMILSCLICIVALLEGNEAVDTSSFKKLILFTLFITFVNRLCANPQGMKHRFYSIICHTLLFIECVTIGLGFGEGSMDEQYRERYNNSSSWHEFYLREKLRLNYKLLIDYKKEMLDKID